MDKVVASDHPDCAGGIVWSPCELRWINSKIEQQAERIHELEVRLSGASGYCVQCEALAAQNQAMREAIHGISLCEINSMSSRQEMGRLARCALALPDLATPILAERDAKTLEDAICKETCEYCDEVLRHMAQELRNKSPIDVPKDS